MRTFEKRQSGLIAPSEPKPDTPMRGPLEFAHESERKRAYELLEELNGMASGRFHGESGRLIALQQRTLIAFVAEMLTGERGFVEKT